MQGLLPTPHHRVARIATRRCTAGRSSGRTRLGRTGRLASGNEGRGARLSRARSDNLTTVTSPVFVELGCVAGGRSHHWLRPQLHAPAKKRTDGRSALVNINGILGLVWAVLRPVVDIVSQWTRGGVRINSGDSQRPASKTTTFNTLIQTRVRTRLDNWMAKFTPGKQIEAPAGRAFTAVKKELGAEVRRSEVVEGGETLIVRRACPDLCRAGRWRCRRLTGRCRCRSAARSG